MSLEFAGLVAATSAIQPGSRRRRSSPPDTPDTDWIDRVLRDDDPELYEDARGTRLLSLAHEALPPDIYRRLRQVKIEGLMDAKPLPVTIRSDFWPDPEGVDAHEVEHLSVRMHSTIFFGYSLNTPDRPHNRPHTVMDPYPPYDSQLKMSLSYATYEEFVPNIGVSCRGGDRWQGVGRVCAKAGYDTEMETSSHADDNWPNGWVDFETRDTIVNALPIIVEDNMFMQHVLHRRFVSQFGDFILNTPFPVGEMWGGTVVSGQWVPSPKMHYIQKFGRFVRASPTEYLQNAAEDDELYHSGVATRVFMTTYNLYPYHKE